MERAGVQAEWADILRDLNALTETVIAHDGKRFAVRSATMGVTGKIAQCVGVRLPKIVRWIKEEDAKILSRTESVSPSEISPACRHVVVRIFASI